MSWVFAWKDDPPQRRRSRTLARLLRALGDVVDVAGDPALVIVRGERGEVSEER